VLFSVTVGWIFPRHWERNPIQNGGLSQAKQVNEIRKLKIEGILKSVCSRKWIVGCLWFGTVLEISSLLFFKSEHWWNFIGTQQALLRYVSLLRIKPSRGTPGFK